MDRSNLNKKSILFYFVFVVLLCVALYLTYRVYFVDTTSTKSKWPGQFAGALALLLAACKYLEISYINQKDSTIRNIIKYFKKGEKAYFKGLLFLILFLAVVFSILLIKSIGVSFIMCFVCGIFVSYISNYIYSYITTVAFAKSLYSDNLSFLNSVRIFMNSSIASSSFSVGASLIFAVVLYHIYKDYQIVAGFVFGYCMVTCINSNIFYILKKTISNTSNVAKNSYIMLDEYDKKNPLLLLKNITESIFPLNTQFCELISSFLILLISSISVGALSGNLIAAFFPIVISYNAFFASIITLFFIRVSKKMEFAKIFIFANCIYFILFSGLMYYTTNDWFHDEKGIIGSVLVGFIIGVLFCFASIKYSHKRSKHAKRVIYASILGDVTANIQTFKEGCSSLFIPCFLLFIGIISSFILADGMIAPLQGLWGITLSALGMMSAIMILSTIGAFTLHLIKSEDSIIEQNESDYFSIIDTVNILYSSIKTFINSSQLFVYISCLIAFTVVAELEEIDFLNPFVMSSAILGLSIPYLYIKSSISGICAVSKKVSVNIKQEFKNGLNLLNDEYVPDYVKYINIALINAIVQNKGCVFIILLILILIGCILKLEAMVGFMIGIVLSSFGLSISSSNSSIVANRAEKFYKDEYINSNHSIDYSLFVNNKVKTSDIDNVITYMLNPFIKMLLFMAFSLIPLFM